MRPQPTTCPAATTPDATNPFPTTLGNAGAGPAHATVCPHTLGPLNDAKVESSGIVECPWHGYRFDIRTRACVRGNQCSLAPAPEIRIESGKVVAHLRE